LTAQGHPRAIFKRAIENGNLVVAEMTARQLGRLTLEDSLALTALVAKPARSAAHASHSGGCFGCSRKMASDDRGDRPRRVCPRRTRRPWTLGCALDALVHG
jgi:hypothetical protein